MRGLGRGGGGVAGTGVSVGVGAAVRMGVEVGVKVGKGVGVGLGMGEGVRVGAWSSVPKVQKNIGVIDSAQVKPLLGRRWERWDRVGVVGARRVLRYRRPSWAVLLEAEFRGGFSPVFTALYSTVRH